MAWHIRKSIRLPLGVRINLSETGVGASIGVRGMRVGRDARGKLYRALSIPGTGLYERMYFGRKVTTNVKQTHGRVFVWMLVTLVALLIRAALRLF